MAGSVWGLLVFGQQRGGVPGNGFQTHTHTHSCTLVSLHSNSIWKSDGIRGVYVDVCVYTSGHFSFSLLASSVHWERARLVTTCRLCVGVCVCKHEGLMYAFHHSSSGEKSDPCSAELNLNAWTDTQSIRKRENCPAPYTCMICTPV